MDLSRNPYEIIPRPSFNGKEANKHIETQWKEWKAQIRQVHDIYKKLLAKKKVMGEESTEFASFLGTLQLSAGYVQKHLRDNMGLTASINGSVIIEAARRFVANHTYPELYEIDEEGYLTPWERDLL